QPSFNITAQGESVNVIEEVKESAYFDQSKNTHMKCENINYIRRAKKVKVDQSMHTHIHEANSKSIPLSLQALIENLEIAYEAESYITYLYSNKKEENVCISFINLAILAQEKVKEGEAQEKQTIGKGKSVDNRDLYYNSFEAL